MPDRTPPAPLEFYRAANGQFGWRLKAGNGRGLITPGETFSEERGAVRNFETAATLMGVPRTRQRALVAGARYTHG